MAGLTLKKLIPAFIPLALEIARHLKRDTVHNHNIRKLDNTEEKLATLENLIIKVEKKALGNREEIRALGLRLQIWLALNSLLLIAIAVKLFFY